MYRARSRALAVLITLLASLLLAPTMAHADICEEIGCYQPETIKLDSKPSYRGWAYVANSQFDPGEYWDWSFVYADAWRWSGTMWSETDRMNDDRIWAHPFAPGWHWTWDSQEGWLAMRSRDLELRVNVWYTPDRYFTARAAQG